MKIIYVICFSVIGFIPESTRKRNERRHVLLEKTGCGKSATGNTILRSGRFRTMISGLNVIHACSQNFTDRFNRRIVVDTPGILDAEETNEIIQDQLDAKNIITEECLMICPSILRRFNENCGNRVLTFDNNLEGLEQNEQVQTLFDILLEIVKRDHVNTIDMYTEAEKKILLVEEEKLQHEREKLEEELKHFDQKHEQAIGGLNDQVKELSRKQDREEREIEVIEKNIQENESTCKIPIRKSTQRKEIEHELAVMRTNLNTHRVTFLERKEAIEKKKRESLDLCKSQHNEREKFKQQLEDKLSFKRKEVREDIRKEIEGKRGSNTWSECTVL